MIIACDLDGTLAHYDKWRGIEHIGNPVPEVLRKVKAALNLGHEVVIFTARATQQEAVPYIQEWCQKWIGRELPVTNKKEYHFSEIWDDRAIGIQRNSGESHQDFFIENDRPPALWYEL